MVAATHLKRADVSPEQMWNWESLFESWTAFQAEADDITARLPEFAAFTGKLNAPTVVADWLETYTAISRRIFPLLVFTRMATAVDTNDAEAKAKNGQVMTLMG